MHRRRIGFVFQDARLLPHLNVRQNLLYGYRLNGTGERPIGLPQVVGLLGLERLLERGVSGLSGGERQRVAIGRALLANPRLLLMDEPLSSLDLARRAEVLRYIEQLRDETRIPILYVSHALEEVARLADNLVLVDHGRVLASGTAAAVLSRSELRDFGGADEAGALIESRVIAHDRQYGLTTLAYPGGTLLAAGVEAAMGARVRVRVRARDVSLALSAPSDTSMLNVLRGRITALVEVPCGAVDARIDIGGADIYARVARMSVDRLGLGVGAEVYALVKAVSLGPSNAVRA